MKIKDFITTATIVFLIVGSLTINSFTYGADSIDKSIEMPAEILRNKIRGGLLGQLLGNLNGLKHEMKYINEPGNVDKYIPALPEGA